MIYVKENDMIKKYQIEIDKEKLKALKIKIINECSKIEHIKIKKKEDYFPNIYDFLHVRNFTKKFSERISNNDFYGPPMLDIYEIEYDFYHEPKIVEIIDKALNDNEESTLELLEYKSQNKSNELECKLNEIIKNKTDDEKLMEVLEEAKAMLRQKKLNAKQKNVEEYLPNVKSCVRLILVDEISLEDYNRVCLFADKELINIKPGLQKKI